MTGRFLSWRWIVGVMGACLLQNAVPAAYAASANFQVKPAAVNIGLFFGGARLTVTGKVPRGAVVVMEILGKTTEEDLMRKGKEWELWMNMGEVDVDGAPSLFLVKSSSPGAVTGSGAGAKWGYGALEKRISFKGRPKSFSKDRLFKEFIRLKESQGVYGVASEGVALNASGTDYSTAKAVFQIPTRVAPGTYRVCLYAIRNGQVVLQQSVPLQVTMVGVPAFLASMARVHMVLYGFMAVLIAMSAGLLTGVIFKKKAGHH